MAVKLRKISGDIGKKIQGMLDRTKLLDGYISRYVLPDYLRAQRQRFQNENIGPDFDGGQWDSLDPKYAVYKRKRYASYPGGGDKVNIRTTRLLSSLTFEANVYDEPDPENNARKLKGKRKTAAGGGSEFSVIVQGGKLSVYSFVPYAQYADEKRTFSKWSPSFYQRQVQGAMQYLIGNIL